MDSGDGVSLLLLGVQEIVVPWALYMARSFVCQFCLTSFCRRPIRDATTDAYISAVHCV